MSLLRSIATAALLAFASIANAQLSAKYRMINPLDRPSHIDLLSTDTITVQTTPRAVWISANPQIATVNANGLVRARKTGVTTITATRGKAVIPIKVCVSPLAEYDIQTNTQGAMRFKTNTYKNSAMQLTSADTVTHIDWSGCEHWFIGVGTVGAQVPDTSEMSVTNTGLFQFHHTLTTYYVGASVGTHWPGRVAVSRKHTATIRAN